jgi:energy-coupling factor transporter transmembrane protein EcfT
MIQSRHPLARLLAAAILVLAVSVTERPAALALVAALALAALVPTAPVRLLRRMAPFALLAVTMSWVYVVAPDPAYRAVGGSGWMAAGIVAGRIMTMGLLSLAALDGMRPGDLARAIEARGVPRRWVYGTLAAVQFLPALAEDYRMLRLVALPAAGPSRWRRWLAGRTPESFLVLLAGAIRRASAAALSMQLRGLTATSRASGWRHRSFTTADWLLCGGAVLLAIGSGLALP